MRAVIIHRTEGEYRRGRRTRRLLLEPLCLEPRTLLTSLTQVMSAFNTGVSDVLAQASGQAAGQTTTLAGEAFNQTIPVLGRSLYAAILTSVQNAQDNIDSILATPFNVQVPTADSSAWSSVISDLRNDDISVIYPTPGISRRSRRARPAISITSWSSGRSPAPPARASLLSRSMCRISAAVRAFPISTPVGASFRAR